MASEGDLCDIPAMPVRKLNHNPMETDDIEVVTIADEDENCNGANNFEQNLEKGLQKDGQGSKLSKHNWHNCKKCGYYAATKTDLWDHRRTHIRPEKILSCHLCNFVTEFKHHLRTHILAHAGQRLFKCQLCSYTCRYKTMLRDPIQ